MIPVAVENAINPNNQRGWLDRSEVTFTLPTRFHWLYVNWPTTMTAAIPQMTCAQNRTIAATWPGGMEGSLAASLLVRCHDDDVSGMS
jgi:hypothetical protein